MRGSFLQKPKFVVLKSPNWGDRNHFGSRLVFERLSECKGRKLCFGFKQPAKRLQMFKSQFISDLAYGQVGGGNSFFGPFYQLFMDVMLWVLP